MAKGSWPRGKPRNEETKRKISEALRGRKHTPETKKRIKLGMRKHFLEMSVNELEDSAA